MSSCRWDGGTRMSTPVRGCRSTTAPDASTAVTVARARLPSARLYSTTSVGFIAGVS